MWLRRLLVFGASAFLLGVVMWRFAPHDWFRQSGKSELVLLLDWSGSNEENFPVALKGAETITRAVLPGDRLAVYAVGPEVNELYKGTVASPKVLELVRHQIRTLQVSTRQGTALRESFEKVREAFEGFSQQLNRHRSRYRILVVFSDCQNSPVNGQGVDLNGVELPGSMSVVVVGFKGINKDQVIHALQGKDGSNNVHIVPTGEVEQAIDTLLKAMHRAHPINIPICITAVLSCLLLGLVTAVLAVRPPTEEEWEILLTRVGVDEGNWEWEQWRSPIQLSKRRSVTVSSEPDATRFCDIVGLGFEIRCDNGAPMIAPLPSNEKLLQIQETSGSVRNLDASQSLPLPSQVTLLAERQPVYGITVRRKGGKR